MTEECNSAPVCADYIDLGWDGIRPEVAQRRPQVPRYLQETYHWAYLHPQALKVFDREWLVNLILWGNMRRLTELVMDCLPSAPGTRVLQMACVYGRFSARLASCLQATASFLQVVDVAPIQVENMRHKLREHKNAQVSLHDASDLDMENDSVDQVVLFFLLHEQPATVRQQTLAEAMRVVRPGGTIIIVDYHRPSRWNPLRYVMFPVLKFLEPFALDLWDRELAELLPRGVGKNQLHSRCLFGGLYQQLVITLQ